MSHRKLTRQQKAAKRQIQREYMTIFINGRQKRVRREPTIAGLSPDEFFRRNADSIWLVQNEMWELLHEQETAAQDAPLADDCSFRDEGDDWL